MSTWAKTILILAGIGAVLVACRKDPAFPEASTPTPLTLSVPPWAQDEYHLLNIPVDNPLTVEGVALGRKLFYETALSNDYSMSCASCHRQEHAFSDPRRFSIGTDGSIGHRNSMPVQNLAWEHIFFWDARATSLEDQALRPVRDLAEMRNDWPTVEARLRTHPDYPTMFKNAFGSPGIDSMRVVKAIAQFERTLLSYNSAYDRFMHQGDATALTEQQQRGMTLFFGDAHCGDCHMAPRFNDQNIQNVGLPGDDDLGLMGITGNEADRGRFKNVGIRNIAVTAPYMHDGRFATLADVVDFYAREVDLSSPNLDGHMLPWVMGQVDLDHEERADLVAFLHALTDPGFLTDPAFSDPN